LCGASKTGSAFLSPLPVCPPSSDAPDERRGDILAHPTGTAEPLSPGTPGGVGCECVCGKLVRPPQQLNAAVWRTEQNYLEPVSTHP